MIRGDKRVGSLAASHRRGYIRLQAKEVPVVKERYVRSHAAIAVKSRGKRVSVDRLPEGGAGTVANPFPGEGKSRERVCKT
jgi:hypothetical protein